MCGCCVSECNSMESDPEFFGPAALAKGMRFVGDPRDQRRRSSGSNDYNDEHGIWDCTRCYFCNERCPKGVDPRDAIAKLGAESIKHGIDRDMGAKHAKWFVTSAKTTGWLRETELVPRRRASSRRSRRRSSRSASRERGKVPPPFPPHVAKDVKEARSALQPRQASRAATARSASSRASTRSARDRVRGGGRGVTRAERRAIGTGSDETPRAQKAEASRVLQGLPRVALGEGARHLDAGARAEASASSSTSSSR